MNKLDHCYLEALSEALKGNLGEALELRNEADALASEGFSFSEDYGSKYPFIEEAVNTLLGSFDFTRCVRADGSAYGTRGKCKKGTEQVKAEAGGKLTKDQAKTIANKLKTSTKDGNFSVKDNGDGGHIITHAYYPQAKVNRMVEHLAARWPGPPSWEGKSKPKTPKTPRSMVEQGEAKARKLSGDQAKTIANKLKTSTKDGNFSVEDNGDGGHIITHAYYPQAKVNRMVERLTSKLRD